MGIYSLYPYTGYAELAPDTLDFSPHTIFVPTNSIAKPREQNDLLIHGSTFSVKIKNGSVEAFLDNMEAKGLTTRSQTSTRRTLPSTTRATAPSSPACCR